ncbi:3-deoxy-7-phosphoheptulonate synthase [Micromonospora sp. WMMD882]|uniref:3-deoxy-7-phosphoheptulonate synthase n=1 Tax=Micromonospora sp. WMMD882 TaxID=3015151 RepID=UPI00248CFB4C|nr:3-deoxy-7-phosphoheptulonate synthase [Micromonospora sp. WMMD882]WBB81904.1 3-deoxy-7-phosphoheptulonate synthase [Micromonospora sp. WMMD882]
MSAGGGPLVAEERHRFPGDPARPGPEVRRWLSPPAAQQPRWPDPVALARVHTDLATGPGLVDAGSVARLRALLAEVSAGRMRVVQAGDCAEDPAECGAEHVRAKVGMLDALAGVLRDHCERPVARIGRLAGQFAKPRSSPTELVEGRELPAYRGPMVNGTGPGERTPDPERLRAGHHLARSVLAHLADAGRGADVPGLPDESVVWVSHEALLLDYEAPLLRRAPGGGLFLSSTHLPWIGDRTRQLDGAHVRLLAAVVNPVACKVGPSIGADELVRLCAALDPGREPGRLTLVARFGADLVRTALPPLVRAVRRAGHPVVWLCDPMHGNTVRAADGRKVRLVGALVREVEGFQDVMLAEHGLAGGVHLEATPNDVAECRWRADEVPDKPYTTLCDPRLNLPQAVDVVSAWWA